MLSCTVENREKNLVQISSRWDSAIRACEKNELFQMITEYPGYKKSADELNSSGIPGMVRGYFCETACVIYECFRISEKNGALFMVKGMQAQVYRLI